MVCHRHSGSISLCKHRLILPLLCREIFFCLFLSHNDEMKTKVKLIRIVHFTVTMLRMISNTVEIWIEMSKQTFKFTSKKWILFTPLFRISNHFEFQFMIHFLSLGLMWYYSKILPKISIWLHIPKLSSTY